jgi:hypothetical protein
MSAGGIVVVLVGGAPTSLHWRGAFAGQFASPLIIAPLVASLGLAGAFETLAFGQMILAALLYLAALRESRATTALVRSL